jgi:glycosyltransferase involved in cell wall biosynthesis
VDTVCCLVRTGSVRIAFLGTRGVPASHGGFETCVEEVGRRLAARGHTVVVYSRPRPGRAMREYRGMQVVAIRRLRIPGVETLLATALAVCHSLLYHCDVHLLFDSANGPFALAYRLCGRACAVNTDGLGWKREKWGWLARRYYRLAEWATVRWCRTVIADASAMRDYFRSEYGVDSTVIAYGADVPAPRSPEAVEGVLAPMSLSSSGYFLQVTRFEPENDPLLTLTAFRTLRSGRRMVLVGGAAYQTPYARRIAAAAGENSDIVLPGFIYDRETIDTLWCNCLAYIHGNHHGGTNPALLQAMAAGRPVIARDCVFNREVLAEHGYYYDGTEADLAAKMAHVETHTSQALSKAASALERVQTVYTWDRVADRYEELCLRLSGTAF